MSNLAYRLERDVVICAPRETVFGFFTDSPRWASWWGAGSTIDPRPGGRVQIRFPGGVEVSGEVLELEHPTRMVFTYGFVSGDPIPAGSSRVTIRLDPHQHGTHLHLAHEFANEKARDEHIQGWRYHLALFSNVVADELHANVASVADAWFEAWAEGDEKRREAALRRVSDPGIVYRDRFSNTAGIDDLLPHVAATHRFMPGFRLRRVGDVRQCQGTALVEWIGAGADGQERGRGTSVFELGPTGKVRSVTGLWARER